MSAIPHNGMWIVPAFIGANQVQKYDVIKRCGEVIANDVTMTEAFMEAENAERS